MTADQDVFNALNGSDGNAALPYALAAMLYNANLLGLGKDYAYPETSNTTSSRYDQITTLAKLLTRTHKHADGNTYDLWDAVHTILKWVLIQAPHINDDEKNSVNHKAP
ncbi:MAG: hypothetical protein ACXVYB_16010 [Arthrobacter sp.]